MTGAVIAAATLLFLVGLVMILVMLTSLLTRKWDVFGMSGGVLLGVLLILFAMFALTR